MHATDLGLVPSIPIGPSNTARNKLSVELGVTPNYHWMWPQNKANKQRNCVKVSWVGPGEKECFKSSSLLCGRDRLTQTVAWHSLVIRWHSKMAQGMAPVGFKGSRNGAHTQKVAWFDRSAESTGEKSGKDILSRCGLP